MKFLHYGAMYNISMQRNLIQKVKEVGVTGITVSQCLVAVDQ